MKNIVFLLLIVLTGSVKAQVPIKSDGTSPKNAGVQRNETLSSVTQGKANQGSTLLPIKKADGARTAKPAALPLKAPNGASKAAKTATLPIKPGGGNAASAKAAAVIPLRTADNAAKKL